MNTLGRSAVRSPVLFSDEDSERENKINLKPIIKNLKRLGPVAPATLVSSLSADSEQKIPGRRKRDRADSTGSTEAQIAHKKRRDSGQSTSCAGSPELTSFRGDTAPQSATDIPSDAESDSSRSGILPATPARALSKAGLRYSPPSDFTSFALALNSDHITVEDTRAKGCELWLLEVPADVDTDALGGLKLSLDDRHRRLTESDSPGGVHLEAICSRWSESSLDATILLPSRLSETQLRSAPVPTGLIQIVKAVDAEDEMAEPPAKVKRTKRSREKRPLPEGLKIRYRPIGCTSSVASGVTSLTRKKDHRKKKDRTRKSY